MSYFLARLALTVSSVTVALCDRGFAATPQAIAEGRFISLGGIEQWVTIRGADRDGPVLLFLHGGPGDAQSSLEDVYAPIERNFVLVQWDQRGAGKTLAHSGRERQGASLEQLIADSIELTKYIRTYLHTSNVVLVGHSWDLTWESKF